MNKIAKMIFCLATLQTAVLLPAASAGEPIAMWLLNNSAWHSGNIWIEDEAGNRRGDVVQIKQASGYQQVEPLGAILPGWTVRYSVDGTFFGYQKTYAYDDIAALDSADVLITFEQKTNRALDATLSRYIRAEGNKQRYIQGDVSDVPEKYLLGGKVNMRKIKAEINRWAKEDWSSSRAIDSSITPGEIDEVIRAVRAGGPSWHTIAESLEQYKVAKEKGEWYVATKAPDATFTENFSAFLLGVVRAINDQIKTAAA